MCDPDAYDYWIQVKEYETPGSQKSPCTAASPPSTVTIQIWTLIALREVETSKQNFEKWKPEGGGEKTPLGPEKKKKKKQEVEQLKLLNS